MLTKCTVQETKLCWQFLEKWWNIKFYENGSDGSRVVASCGQTYGRKDITKLLVSFRNFAKAPKNQET
jgi:hypothetical protein